MRGGLPADAWQAPRNDEHVGYATLEAGLVLRICERFGTGGLAPSKWWAGLGRGEQAVLLAWERVRGSEA